MLNVRKKILYIVLLIMMVLTACGKTEEKKEPPKTEQTDKQEDSTESSEAKGEDSQSTADVPNDAEVQEPGNHTESNENQSNKNETTTKPSTGSTTKPSTGSTGNSGSTNNSGNTGGTQNNNTSITTQPVHEHNWVEVTEDEIHYYAWRTICGKCGEDLTDMSEDDRLLHVTIICRSRYGTVYKEVDFVTENVVKTPVITGYKCECGAEKK